MANGLVGADPDELDRAAERLRRSAERIASVHGDVGRVVRSTPWAGPDADRFASEWGQRGRAAIEGASGLLRSAADTLARNAEDQRRTSEAGTAALSGITLLAAHTGPEASPVPPGPGGPGDPAYPDPAGQSPQAYADQLQRYWLDRAYANAGIDPDTWNPQDGAAANRANIEAVYTYYGRLFLDHPELQWAGMANMIGPSFAAGFFDLGAVRDVAGKIDGSIDHLPPGGGDALLPGARQLGQLAELSEEELSFYETTFLTMQKDIFRDQAVMHEAYLQGGMPAIEDLRRAGLVDRHTVDAWSSIDRGTATGDQSLIQKGNTELLRREQWEIINESYDRMHDRPVTGEAMTYLMTLIGEGSIPGTHFYGEVMPLEVSVETPGPERIGTPSSVFGVNIPHVSGDNPLQGEVTVVTPLPDGNIANSVDRWNLIMKDTLPAYQALLSEDPARATAIISSPIDQRIDDSRLIHRLDDIAGQIDNWAIEVDQ